MKTRKARIQQWGRNASSQIVRPRGPMDGPCRPGVSVRANDSRGVRERSRSPDASHVVAASAVYSGMSVGSSPGRRTPRCRKATTTQKATNDRRSARRRRKATSPSFRTKKSMESRSKMHPPSGSRSKPLATDDRQAPTRPCACPTTMISQNRRRSFESRERTYVPAERESLDRADSGRLRFMLHRRNSNSGPSYPG